MQSAFGSEFAPRRVPMGSPRPFPCRLHGKGLVLVLAALCSVHGAPVEKCEGNCVDGEGTYSFSDGTVYTVCVHQCALKVDPA